MRSDQGVPVRLGSVIAERFRDAGVDAEIREFRGNPVRGADFDEE